MHKNLFILFFFLIAAYLPLFASANISDSSGKLSGIVIDVENSEPVSFAYIHLEQINRSATTDREGRFELRNIPSGTYNINIHRIGYSSINRTVEIEPDQTTEISFSLTPSVLSGQTVEVVADAEQLIGSNLEHASLKIVGDRLRRDLDVTLSST